MKTKQLVITALALTVAFTSCNKDNPEPEQPATPSASAYDNGVFITNEGPFGSGTGTISFYSRSNGALTNDIFEAKNSYPLGNVVQSMSVHNGKGYIVVNNAGKVEVVDAGTFASGGVISGLNSPRYFLGIDNNKGYISEWGLSGAGSVKVVDLNSKTVTATIATGKGAEGMVKVGNKVYVACSGGFENDSVVTVIDATTNTVLSSIDVGPNPKSIQVDANGKVWVLCSGQWNMSYTMLEQPGSLVCINTTSDVIELTLSFASMYSQPFNLVTNSAKTTLYYTYDGKVYSHAQSATALSTAAVINRNFYAVGVDPTNDYFYCTDAGNFSSNGKVLRYNATGMVVDSFTVGIIPGGLCFK
jgi:YVTN family beta-propeller protein